MAERELVLEMKLSPDELAERGGSGKIVIPLPDSLDQVPLNRYLPFLREVEKLRLIDHADAAKVIFSTVKAASEFTGIDIKELARTEFGDAVAESSELAGNLNNLIAHIFRLVGQKGANLKRRSTFNYRGDAYTIPTFMVDALGGTVLPKLSVVETIEAAEALRLARQYVDETGDPTGSHEFSGYLRMMAAICQKTTGGKIEHLPLEDDERERFLTERASHFSEIPTGVALEVDFFLGSSLKNSKNIRFAATSLNARSFVLVAEIFLRKTKPSKKPLRRARLRLEK